MERNPVGWFEVPVEDMERAIKFYKRFFGYKMARQKIDVRVAWFPMEDDLPGSARTLIDMPEMYDTGGKGTLIYFSSPTGDVQNELKKVKKAGGQIIVEKNEVGEYGFVGVFIDSEGNRIGVHSMK